MSHFPSSLTANRISSPFFLNDHFVASMSPSLKLSLSEDRHGCTSLPAIPWRLPGREDRRHSRASHLSRQDEADQMVTWKVLYTRLLFSRQSNNTSIFIQYKHQNSGFLHCDAGQPTLMCSLLILMFVLRIPICRPFW